MIAAGRMDQRVTIESKSVTRAANGEEVVTWGTLATVWAEVIPLRGREFFAAAQNQQAVDVRLRIRERSDLTGDMRLQWRGQPYDITAVIPGTGHYVGTQEIMAVSGVRNGR